MWESDTERKKRSPFVWWETNVSAMLAKWKSNTKGSGEQSVMITGIYKMAHVICHPPPFKFVFRLEEGHPILVELKSGTMVRGVLYVSMDGTTNETEVVCRMLGYTGVKEFKTPTLAL
ncbi:hypothetical protein QZH41_015695 [Actinostola sp. cb2023]|nr:hypothetical protein QZH41_015695 [Actinostola sp. cb2023]